MQFSLVSTVFNEIDSLASTIKNLEAQLLQPKEIVIVDAGSIDGTFESLLEWKNRTNISVKLISEPGCNVARGRNIAIRNASFDVIVSTDFGCLHQSAWLSSLIEPLGKDPQLEVVGGAYSVVEKEITALSARAEYILQNGYDIPIGEGYTVTSRSIAFRKCVWEDLEGYPEWLTLAGDDSIFWKRIRRKGYNYKIVAQPQVFWYRHNDLRGFISENIRYGLGDGESQTNYRNFRSHILETFFRYCFFICLIGFMASRSYIFVPFLLLFSFGLRSYLRALKNWLRVRSTKYNFGVFLYSFLLIEILRIAYIKGYIKGMQGRTKYQKQCSDLLLDELSDYAG